MATSSGCDYEPWVGVGVTGTRVWRAARDVNKTFVEGAYVVVDSAPYHKPYCCRLELRAVHEGFSIVLSYLLVVHVAQRAGSTFATGTVYSLSNMPDLDTRMASHVFMTTHDISEHEWELLDAERREPTPLAFLFRHDPGRWYLPLESLSASVSAWQDFLLRKLIHQYRP
jgi:hypothetical protein